MKNFLILIAVFFAVTLSYGQNIGSCTLRGSIYASDAGRPLDLASVVIVNDSLQYRKFVQTDTLGKFSVRLQPGSYLVEISYTGYDKQQHTLNVTSDTLISVAMVPSSEKIKAVVVEASRIEHSIDGYKLSNIYKNRQFTQLTLSNILQTAPGVWVGNGNVSVYGKTATVYMDNRVLNVDNLQNFLRLYSGNHIKDIEVIAYPGDEYGSARSVIKITSNIEQGGMGSVNMRYFGLGTDKKDVYNPSGFVTYKRGNTIIDANASYQYMTNSTEYEDVITREDGDELQKLHTVSKARLPLSMRGSLGFLQNFNKNSFLSLSASGSRLKNTGNRQERDLINAGSSEESNIFTKVTDDKLTFSALYSNKFKNGNKLEVRANYFYTDRTNIYADTLLNIGNYTSDRGDNTTNSVVVNSNYITHLINKKDKFTVGAEYSYIDHKIENVETSNSNVFDYSDEFSKYSTFNYDETLLYGYFNYTYQLQKMGVRVGTRAEYSNLDGTSYFNLRPSALLTFYLNRRKGNILNLEYSRTVSRPRVTYLNPVPIENINGIIHVGNPDLKPASSNNVGLGFTLKNSYTLSASYSHTADVITSYGYQVDDVLYQTYMNGDKRDDFSLSLNINKMLFRWWIVNINPGMRYSKLSGRDISTTNKGFFVNGMFLFMFKHGIQANMNLFYTSSNLSGVNVKENDPVMIVLSVDKSIAKNRFKISLQCSDILNSDKYRERKVYLNDGTVRKSSYKTSSRAFGISVAYNFKWGIRVMRQMQDYGTKDMSERFSD